MAVNKIIYNGETLLDLTEDDITEEDIFKGKKAYNSKGELITGTYITGDLLNLEDYSSFYSHGARLTEYPPETLNTSNATKMKNMFEVNIFNKKDEEIFYFPNFDTSNVTDMERMFYSFGRPFYTTTTSIKLNLSNFDFSNVTNLSSFCGGSCQIDEITFPDNIIIKNPVNCMSMFAAKSYLQQINFFSQGNGKIKILGSTANMFNSCSSLTSLNLKNMDTGSVIAMSSMFRGCSLLTSLNLSNFNTSNVTNMDYMFQDCSSLTSLDLTSFDVSKVESLTNLIEGCTSLTSLDISTWDTASLESGSLFSVSSSYPNLVSLKIGPKTFAKTYGKMLQLQNTGIVNHIDEFIEGLPTIEKGSNNLTLFFSNQSTAQQRQAAADKGWTLS